MPSESPRIAELRRRVEADPASIAFAQLAEEYRRAGNFEAAERCCRNGLVRHPAYLSARVTLGRTLIELGHLDQAEQELQLVLNSAPDNLAAIRGMAEIQQRRGNLESAFEYYRRALPLARHDPELEETVNQIKREISAVRRPQQSAPGLSFTEAQSELLSAAERVPEARRPPSLAKTSDASFPPSLARTSDASFGEASGEAGGETNPPPAAPERAPASATARADAVASSSPSLARPSEAASGVASAGSARTENAPRSGLAAPKPDAGETRAPGSGHDLSIDFDALLKSLGASDRPAPPMVEALLTEPAPAEPRPELVLPELPIEKPPSSREANAALRRGLQEFDQTTRAASERPPVAEKPEEPHAYGEVVPAAPPTPVRPAAPVAPYGEVPFHSPSPARPAQLSQPPSFARASDSETTSASTRPASPVLSDSRVAGVEGPKPTERPSGAGVPKPAQTQAGEPAPKPAPIPSGESSPKQTEMRSAEAPKPPQAKSGGDGAPVASAPAPEITKEQMILDELEAWLAAIKR